MKTRIIVLILAYLLAIFLLTFGIVRNLKADVTGMHAIVPVNYNCYADGFELHCKTNAQHFYLNGDKLY